MDPTKLSLSSKAPHVNSGEGNESVMEDTAGLRRDGVDGERQRDTETREPDVVDGTAAAADINHNHRGSDKHKFSTLGYQRRTKQKVVTDFATVTKGAGAGAKPRAALRQVLFSQGVSEKNPASEERGQLDVLKQDLGAYPVPVSLRWRWKEESRGTTLENSWTEIVHSHSTMPKLQRHQQEALWEFVHTELTYINKLIIIKDLVVAALVNLHQHGFLLEVTPELLFSNIPSLLTSHQLFWQEVIFPMLQEVRRTGKPFDPMRLEAGCLQFHERFAAYQHYCWEEENNLEFTRRQMENNLHFVTYVQWVETHPQCQRMRLGDMQAKPHQRITKYPLLLKAVLKNTQDPHVQQRLRGMLSSVNGFLESINDYLRFKDEELALNISAQRVEGYEVEGINEDIDKHVREICQFDLTCPIRGVGPGVVRKLLLEENLKVRGRKDNKLEVVALLFSDVLLMTKVQKKGERLKVVRPPLALDRTYCMTLKDGSSFVLVEVGELWSAMNVYIFAASTPESCSTWVTNIHQAKETLRNLREMERKRQLDDWKIQQLEAKPVTEAKMDDMESEEKLLTQFGRETFVDDLTEELIVPASINGMLAVKDAEEQYQPPKHLPTINTSLPILHPQPNHNNRKFVHKGLAGQQQAVKGYEWIEMGVRGVQVRIQPDEEGRMVESVVSRDKRTTWNNRVQSAPNLDHFNYRGAGPHPLLFDGYPDVDYPLNEENTSPTSSKTTIPREGPELLKLPENRGISTGRDTDSQIGNHDMRRNSSYVQSGDMDRPSEPWGFSKNLKSPGLQRRRPISTHHGQTSEQVLQGSRKPYNTVSFPNPESDYKRNLKRNSVPSGNSTDSLRVLKLGSLKPTQEFWSVQDRVSPDPQVFSESELPDSSHYNKKSKAKTHRSASIPNIVIEGEHGLRIHSKSLYTLPQAGDMQSPSLGHNPNGHHSPLEGLLERAKVRGKDKHVLKREVKMGNVRTRYHPPSPSFSTTPSQSASEGDRDTEWEEEVELMRHRALTVSEGWKEQLVDGDDDGKRDSVAFTDGVNVDWAGWCFDDDEVMDHVQPGSEGLLEGISRSLGFWDIQGLSEPDDGECSQV